MKKADVEGRDADQLVANLTGFDCESSLSGCDLADADRVMLEYSIKLTLTPQTMVGDDVKALRVVGFEDRAIHDICAIVAYFAFVNRIADGLGVELES